MILVMDVGNTNIVLGLYKKKKLVSYWRLSTDQKKTEDEYGLQLLNLLHVQKVEAQEVEGVIISSVVPHIIYTFEQMCRKYLRLYPMVIGPGIKTGLNIRYDNPRDVGADRIVNAVAAIEEYDGPLIIVDFGTAATFCYIDHHNQYIGGAIAPGMNVAADALYQQASKLPRIEIGKPDHVIGKNTVHAMQSGVYYGYAGQVDGIVSRMKEEAKGNPFVIATGGLAELISKAAKTIDRVDPYLTLKGLCYIYEKNKPHYRKG
ncbi:type III pantothenate kinase [Alteribacillus bidgolensis]|uniref:Type III pantothenate kinase n=1 Tax=Alteribacillus bidgolensis TaxID=930129 RepID=A0A1G8PTW0_9BACI|nr:type III pantothenate kinase [Alteribacillus bidgolensis]SDI95706.1 pantothenate kinase [Alteribacillus bidgolensis]